MAEGWGMVLLEADPALAAAVAAAAPVQLTVATEPGPLPQGLDAVVGVATVPWPGHGRSHDDARERSPAPYYAVESWHGHPAFLAALGDAVARGRAALDRHHDDHVLITAPDRAARGLPPEGRTFLREVTEAVTSERGLERRTLAWDHAPERDPATPTVATMLETLAEAHGRTAVVHASIAPGDPGDPAAVATADRVGIELVQVAPSRDDLVAVLAEVARTVLAHEARP